jgi:hypothetical protein
LISADCKIAGASDRAILPAGATGLLVPIGLLLDAEAAAIEVGVSAGVADTSVAVGGCVSVANGVRVGVRVRVGPNVGKGRSVAVGPIGRGVAVGALHAVTAIVAIRIIHLKRISP